MDGEDAAAPAVALEFPMLSHKKDLQIVAHPPINAQQMFTVGFASWVGRV